MRIYFIFEKKHCDLRGRWVNHIIEQLEELNNISFLYLSFFWSIETPAASNEITAAESSKDFWLVFNKEVESLSSQIKSVLFVK